MPTPSSALSQKNCLGKETRPWPGPGALTCSLRGYSPHPETSFPFSPTPQVSTLNLNPGRGIAACQSPRPGVSRARDTPKSDQLPPRSPEPAPSREAGQVVEGPATLAGEAAANPRSGGLRVPSQGPQSRSRKAGRGSDMARTARRRLQVLGPLREPGRGGAARSAPQPRAGRTGLTGRSPPCSPAHCSCGARPAVGRRPRAAVAHSPLSAPPPPPPPPRPLRFNPRPPAELPAPDPSTPAPGHVTPGGPPHVTTPFLRSPPPAPGPLPASGPALHGEAAWGRGLTLRLSRAGRSRGQ